MAPGPAERPATGQSLFAGKQSETGLAASQPASLPERERERSPSWYPKRNENGTSLAAETELSGAQGAALGCVGSREGSERKVPLSSAGAEATLRAAENETEVVKSDESRGAVPKIGTRARVTGGTG